MAANVQLNAVCADVLQSVFKRYIAAVLLELEHHLFFFPIEIIRILSNHILINYKVSIENLHFYNCFSQRNKL